jgi:uncharacterized protein Yka (UPF0111/DUF47 family)
MALVRLIPHDEVFFDLFNEIAKRASTAAALLERLFAEPGRLDHYVGQIKAVEHEADNLTHDIINRIDKTFVTPIDREDIHQLASELDEVVDLVDGTARRAAMFRIAQVREPAKKLCAVLMQATAAIEVAVKNVRNSKVVAKESRVIKEREEEGDALYHEAVGLLFQGTPDPLDVIKWKELYDTLERALDQCEDVANVVESISFKHA